MSEKSFKCFVCSAVVKVGIVCFKQQVIFIFFMDSLKQLGLAGFGLRTLSCGNEDCKAEFNSFYSEDHVLNFAH
jgi:hypothetical protein